MTEHHSATFLEKALDKEATHNPSVALGASILLTSGASQAKQLACSDVCACCCLLCANKTG